MAQSVLQWISANRGMLIFLGLLILFFVSFRTPATVLPSGELTDIVTQGKPVVLEFYSNF